MPTYSRLSDYASMIDSVLLDFKTSTVPTATALDPVIELLEALKGNPEARFPAMMVEQLVHGRVGNVPRRATAMIAELKKRLPSDQTIADLEELAVVLDQERALMESRKTI